MAEMIDIFDENWNPTGEVLEKNEAERQKKWHLVAQVWIVNLKGELLLQLRSPNKKFYPNMWDASAAGHVCAGEGIIDAGIRETHEELGIDITGDQLIFISKGKFYGCHHLHTDFLVKLDLPLDALTFNDHEIAEVKYIPWRELAKMNEEEKAINKILPYKVFIQLFEYFEKNGL